MARLKLSPSGLRSPLDVGPAPEAAATTVAPPAPVTPLRALEDVPATDEAPAAPVVPPAAVLDAPPAPAAAPADEAPAVGAPLAADPVLAPGPATFASDAQDGVVAEAGLAPEAPPVAVAEPAPAPDADAADGDVPAWAADLDPAALQPDRLLGRPRQTALILDRVLSERTDALVAATGPRVTFAGLVAAILQFHLPPDPADAAPVVGAYRRRRLDDLDRPWEERNARIPTRLREDLDAATAAAAERVAGVSRSTLVNALLDAHLPTDPQDAARLVTRMEMVRGGAFLA